MRKVTPLVIICFISLFFTSCQKDSTADIKPADQLENPGFESDLNGWKIEAPEGFTTSPEAAKSGQKGLKFSTSSSTPWSGRIYQTLNNMPDGEYTLSAYAEAYGSGMYLWADGGADSITAPLAQAFPGTGRSLPLNQLTFTIKGGTANVGFILADAQPATDPQPTMTLEAESGLYEKSSVLQNHNGYTGTGFIDFIDNTGAFVEWTLNKPTAGQVTLGFRYANGSTTNRPLKLDINGTVVEPALAFPSTAGWAKWSTVTITANLNAGTNKIRLTTAGISGPNIDHLFWTESFNSPYFYADDVQLIRLP